MRAYQLAVLCAALNGVLPKDDPMTDTTIVKEVSAQECVALKTTVALLIERAGARRQVKRMQALISAEKAFQRAIEADDK